MIKSRKLEKNFDAFFIKVLYLTLNQNSYQQDFLNKLWFRRKIQYIEVISIIE